MYKLSLVLSCTFESPICWQSRGCGEAETHRCLLYMSMCDSLASECLVFRWSCFSTRGGVRLQRDREEHVQRGSGACL